MPANETALVYRSRPAAGHPFGLRTLRLPVAEARVHAHVLGKTGSGKSYFLASLFLAMQRAGMAATLLDPHGDLAELVLSHLVSEGGLDTPEQRQQLIYLDLPAAAARGLFLPFNVLAQPYVGLTPSLIPSLTLVGTCFASPFLVAQGSTAVAAPRLPRPPKPTNLRLVTDTQSETASNITVIWRQRLGNGPGLTLLGNEIQESVDPRGPWQTAAQLVLSSPGTNDWTSKTLPPGTFKCYRVRSTTGGRKPTRSSWTKPACAITLVKLVPNPDELPKALAPPTNLSATWVSRSSIRLTWKDNSDDESGFQPGGVADGWAAASRVGDVVLPPNSESYVFENIPSGPNTPVIVTVGAYIGDDPRRPAEFAEAQSICLERETPNAIKCP